MRRWFAKCALNKLSHSIWINYLIPILSRGWRNLYFNGNSFTGQIRLHKYNLIWIVGDIFSRKLKPSLVTSKLNEIENSRLRYMVFKNYSRIDSLSTFIGTNSITIFWTKFKLRILLNVPAFVLCDTQNKYKPQRMSPSKKEIEKKKRSIKRMK